MTMHSLQHAYMFTAVGDWLWHGFFTGSILLLVLLQLMLYILNREKGHLGFIVFLLGIGAYQLYEEGVPWIQAAYGELFALYSRSIARIGHLFFLYHHIRRQYAIQCQGLCHWFWRLLMGGHIALLPLSLLEAPPYSLSIQVFSLLGVGHLCLIAWLTGPYLLSSLSSGKHRLLFIATISFLLANLIYLISISQQQSFALLKPILLQLGMLGYASIISTALLPRYLKLRTRIGLHQHAQELTRQQNQRKDQFFSLLANDLKTPLLNLGAYFELLLRHIQQVPAAHKQELLVQANRAARQLHHMLENLLAWARNEMHPIAFEPRPLLLQDLVQRHAGLFGPLAQYRKVSIHLHLLAGAEVIADAYMVDFVLRNLLHNAVRHTPAGTQIVVSTYQRDKQLCINIHDQGTGIPLHVLQQLAQNHGDMPLKSTEKGSGLGLLMSQHFLRVHHSRLHIENSLQGCQCSFTLPLYYSNEDENKKTESQHNNPLDLVN